MVFRKSILRITACVALTALWALSSTIQARPLTVVRDTDIPQFRLHRKPTIHATSVPTCESTGFEPVEATCGWETGFMCGSGFVGICSAPPTSVCTGDNSSDQNCCIDNPNPLNGWYMSINSRNCNEPHMDTANPATGTQHMRFQSDASLPPCGFAGCRISAFTPTAGRGLPLGRTVISFDIAMGDPSPGLAPFGSRGQYFTVGEGAIGVNVRLDYQGVIFAYDNALSGYQGVGFLTGGGAYDHLEIDQDPCRNIITYTLTNALGAVAGFYSHDFTGVPSTMERAIFTNDNGGFFWDLDNYSVDRSGIGCEPACIGNGVQDFLGEECDGTDDLACPGRCRPPEGDLLGAGCTCIRPCTFCSSEEGCVAQNGVNGPFLTHGGFFTYVAESQFTGIDTCGSDFDTTLFVGGDDFCAPTGAFVVNDECAASATDCTDANTDTAQPLETCMPFASCYNNNPNFESCVCIDAVPGSTITIWAAGFPGVTPPLGSHLMLTITNALSCGPGSAAIPNGACCRGLTGMCEDNVVAQDCAGPSDTYSHNKLCTMVNCARDTGGCCDLSPGLGGVCTPGVFPEDCTGTFLTYSKLDDTCGGSCEEITGACCDGLTGNCFEVIQSTCPASAPWFTWTMGATCQQIACVAADGACCDTGTNDPTVSICTQTIKSACDCTKCSWTKGVLCEQVECLPNFQIIPTVSQWGLVVLTLLLLVAGKIHFARRAATSAQ